MSKLILPPSHQGSPGPTDPHIDLYDSEILAIEKLTVALNQEIAGRRFDLEDTSQRIQGEYEALGFVVDVKWFTTTDHGFVPQVEIRGRISNEEFDHDRMVHEVTSNILGIDTDGGGVIKSQKG